MPLSLETRIYHQFSHDPHVKPTFTYKYSHDPHIPLCVSTVCDVNTQYIYIYITKLYLQNLLKNKSTRAVYLNKFYEYPSIDN